MVGTNQVFLGCSRQKSTIHENIQSIISDSVLLFHEWSFLIKWNLISYRNLESIFSAPSPLLLIIHSQIAWWFMKTAIMLPRVLHSNSQFWLFKSNIGWMDARGTWSQCRGSLFHSGQPSLKIPIFCLTLDYMSLAYAND